MKRPVFVGTLAVLAFVAVFGTVSAGTVDVLFCAPGYPGTTEHAGPTMAHFAEVLAAEAGSGASSVRAVYHETEAGCLSATEDLDPAVVLATLPFWLAHRDALRLRPVLLAVPPSGAQEIWTLVAKRGRIGGPGDLDGFAIESIAGFSPAFVRGPALAAWGALPASTDVVFTARVLSSLRSAARGDAVAVLLDGSQAAGLERLPFADELEVVARSPAVPAYLVCDRPPDADGTEVRAVLDALPRLDGTANGRETLGEIRLERFEALPDAALDAAIRAFDRALATP